MSNPKHKLSGTKRWVLIGALIFFAFQLTLPALVVPRQAEALLGVSITIGDIPRLIWDSITKALKTAGDVAYKNVLTQFLNNLAYNAATKVATGDWGQKPLFPTKPGELLTQAADVAAGDFLDSLVNTWGQTGNCNGFSAESCGRDSDCSESVLFCPESAILDAGMIGSADFETYGNNAMAAFCSESKKNYDNCMAVGCTVVQLSSDTDISGAGKNVPEGSFIALGYPQCISGGFSLCDNIGDPIKLKLNIMAREVIFGPPPEIRGKCPLSEIIDNFEEGVTEWAPNLTSREKTQLYLVEISKSFNPKATDVGAYLEVISKTRREGAIAKEKTEFAQGLAGAFNAVTSPITGAIKTPAPLVGNVLEQIVGSSLAQKMVYTGSPLADALGVFTNTLASKLMTRFLEKGLVDDSGGGRGFGGIGGIFGGSRPGVTAAKIMFADLKQADYSVGGEVDILSKLASCPDKNDPTPDSCVIDSRFRTAIQQRMTVREALDQGLLDGTRIFGYDANGWQPEYYNGYPYRSLVILRKYRIIPVGWELAAKYIKNYGAGNYGINTLVQEYNNPSSPFYRLVDPNWVLKAPDVYCKRQGAGEKIQYEQAIRDEDTNNDRKVDGNDAAMSMVQRQGDYCADEQLCLAENEDGSCKRYGYCVEEKPFWKFDGTSCSSHYNTCQTFTGPGGEASYLKNTVNYDGCNAGNAGCQWYCQDWSTVTDQWVCTNEAPPNGGEKMSFNRNAEECSEEAEGCNEFISIKDSGANLLKNSGFEDFVTTDDNTKATDGIRDSGDPASSSPDEFLYWRHDNVDAGNPCGDRKLAVTDAFEGLTAARIHAYDDCPGEAAHYTTQGVNTGYLTDNRTFTVSFYAKRAADDAECADISKGNITMQLQRTINNVPPKVVDDLPLTTINVANTWTRYTAAYTFGSVLPNDWNAANIGDLPDLQRFFTLFFRRDGTDGCDIILDNVKVEEGYLSSYTAYGDSAKDYLRKAPDYYNCYDKLADDTLDISNDDPACGNYAISCSAGEVGCEAYASMTRNLVVTSNISNPDICVAGNPVSCDQCPAEFVGCQAYRELLIEHAPRRPARDPVSFIADTGASCPASAVGCEEYTNLEEVALGGEGKEYYSWIKQCVNTDDANLNTYYTWEGSDEFGYQLKKYQLKQSNLDDGPCTNMAAENVALGANSWPACIDDIDFDENGDGIDEEHPAATCLADDVGVNPDCAEFYDTAGNTFYRLRSRVIYASDNCKSYRNTVDGPSVLYHLIPGEGKSCSADYVGCRSYKGNAGDNIRVIYEEDFESGTVDPWIGDGLYSNESTYVGGHSMLVSNSAAINNAGEVLGFQADRSYTVSFWAKAAVVDTPVSFSFNTAPALTFPGQAVTRVGEWGRYEIGPIYIPVGTDLSANQLLTFGSNAFYIDNIIITEIFENIYLIKDSYTECPGYENCDQYSDRLGSIHYLKSFSKLCGEDKVGCEVMIDTQNTASPDPVDYKLSIDTVIGEMDGFSGVDKGDYNYLDAYFNTGGPAPNPLTAGDLDRDGDVDIDDLDFLNDWLFEGGPAPSTSYIFNYGTIPADEIIILVNDSEKSCASTNKGCERLGQPSLGVDGNVDSFTDVYLKNNPDKYDDISCLYERSDCNEYITPGGSRFYFKNPGNKVCEFKRVTGQDAAGWYTLGTDHGAPDCPVSIGLCMGGNKEGMVCNSSDDCGAGGDCVRNDNVPTQPLDNWVGLCPAGDSGCTEYRDPEQPMIDPSSISSVNLAVNGSFEEEPLYAGNMSLYYTDGQYDTQIPDEMIGWRQRQTDAGFCNDNNAATCNVDGDCSVYGASGCNTADRVPCGNRLAAVTDAVLGPLGASPTDGDKAILMQSYDYCNKGGGDPALYVWHGFDTGYLTDNRSFQVSFDARQAPGALDADCGNAASNSDISFQLERVIDDRTSVGYADYLTSYTITATDSWERYDYTFHFSSAPRDWVATKEPLEQIQRRANLIFRRAAEDVNPAPPDNPVCDVLIDNVKIEEVTGDYLDYTPYYYINDTVDQATCNGIVSREQGCRLFEDTSNVDLPYSSADSENGEPPALCEGIPDSCDSNMVLNVIRDRECKRWLECETTVWSESDEGKTEELCTSRYLCNKMDEETGYCTNPADYEDVNQTFTTPAFADKIKHYSGMVLAGLDWGKRCSNDPSIVCTSDNNCLGGTCSDPQIIQGYLQYPSMEQVGTISTEGDLIKYGDFGDGDYKMNQALSCWLTGGSEGCGEIDPSDLKAPLPMELKISDVDFGSYLSSWGSTERYGSGADMFITEENINNGSIPSTNANLDENNVIKVVTRGDTDPVDDSMRNGNYNGITYDLGSSVIQGEQYVVSFKLRWSGAPLVHDKIRVELHYFPGVAGGHWQSVAADIRPSEKWQEYSLGPITAGYPNGLIELASFDSVSLNIVHSYSPSGAEVPSVTFYLDDVSMKPVLEVRYGVCKSWVAGYPDNGKQCKSIGDCVLPGYDDGAVACNEQKNIARSCRLYPKDDAQYCDYVDENNVIYQGWKGYCIEHDPNNSKYCLNWWPVDLLLGESDAFGALPSFMYAGRRPQYMCIQSRGNANIPVDLSYQGAGRNAITVFDALMVETAVPEESPLLNDPFGLKVPLTIHANGDDDRIDDLNTQSYLYIKCNNDTFPGICGGCNTACGNRCTWLNDEYDDIPGASDLTGTWDVSLEQHFYKWEIEKIAVIMQRPSVDNWNPAMFGDAKYIDGTSMPPNSYGDTVDGPAYMILDERAEPFCGGSWCGVWQGISEAGGERNSIAISFGFDVNNQLHTMRAYGSDATCGGGMIASIIVYLRDQCQYLAEVISSNPAQEPPVWSSRIIRSSQYSVPDLLYRYSNSFAPFGGIAHPAGDPDMWKLALNTGPLEVRRYPPYAHAGTPYSYMTDRGGNSSGRYCSTLENNCSTENEVNDCFDDNGYCIGPGNTDTGQGFCEKNAARYCTVATQVADCTVNAFDYGPCVVLGGGAAGLTTYQEGIERLKRLFVDIYSGWRWDKDEDGGVYVQDTDILSYWQDENADPIFGYKNMPSCYQTITGLNRPDYPDDYCGMPPVIKNIRVGDLEGSGTLTLGPQGGKVQLSFTIDADKDQLPIRYIKVDWDDGTFPSIFAGRYAAGTIVFTHNYTRSRKIPYTPEILVSDNWDWCGVLEGQNMLVGDHRYTGGCDRISTGIQISVVP